MQLYNIFYRDKSLSADEVHRTFMKNYSAIFAPETPMIGLPVHSEERIAHKVQSKSETSMKTIGI